MARRSERVKTNNESARCESPPEDITEPPDEDYIVEKPQRKKQRLSTSHKPAGGRKVRGKQGLLKQLPEMPLDILFEIFSEVDPGDLMQLTRTTKALRAILMSRSAMSIWKSARSNLVGLPPCPQDMTEPQYAVMLFDPFCHYCSGKARDYVWQLRIRCCQQCASDRFVLDFRVPGCIGDILRYELVRLLPSYMKKLKLKRSTSSQTVFHLKTIELWQAELAHCNSTEEKTNWAREKRAIALARELHGSACCRWLEEQEVNRNAQLDDIRLGRTEEIISRLAHMGWKEEIDMMPDQDMLLRHPQVWQRKGLTERAWNNMKQSLINLMEKCKSDRLVEEYKVFLVGRLPVMEEVRNSFAQTCAPDAIIPSVADMCFFVPFRTILHDFSHSEVIDVNTFATATAQLPELIQGWTEQTTQKLLKMIPTSGAVESTNDSSKLLLASTFFECNRCNQCGPIVYPRIFIHSGATSPHDETCDVQMDPYGIAVTEILSQTPWNLCGQINFHLPAHNFAVTVLNVCGFDPETTTAQQMDEAGPVLECLSCQNDQEGRLFMTWRGAVVHACETFPDHSSPNFWALASGETQMKAKFKLDEALMHMWSMPGSENLFCVHCRQTGNYLDLKSHLRSHHPEMDQSKSSMHPVLDAYHLAEPVRLLTDGYQV